MERLEYNRKIINKLEELVETYPDLRFGQILANCGIIQYKQNVLTDGEREDILTIDPFYEEPQTTWDRMLKYERIN